MRPLLIGGPPGSGKTTIARRLAELDEKSVCLETDYFFDVVTNLIHPAKPESHDQNHVVITAYCHAARAYHQGGYNVIIEGVLGPWFLPLVANELDCDFDYIVLDAALDTLQARVIARKDQEHVPAEVVEKMHKQFQQATAEYQTHIVQTDGVTVEDITSEILANRKAGKYLTMGDPV